jgi:hypothetical protein
MPSAEVSLKHTILKQEKKKKKLTEHNKLSLPIFRVGGRKKKNTKKRS